MSDKPRKFSIFYKINLKKNKTKFSFHYVAYTVMSLALTFSFIRLVGATTPNPGHPWSELGDGVFVFSNSQTATPYTYTFPAANTTVLTTNSAVTVAQGGTGLTSVALGSVLAANSANVLSAVTSTSGTKVLTNTAGVITWETGGGSMVYPGSGIANSTGSAWGTSYSTTGSGTVLALATTPTFITSITTPKVIGGTETTSDLYLQTTSGVGTTDADMHFLVGNAGGTEAITILNNGNVGVGATSPNAKLEVSGGDIYVFGGTDRRFLVGDSASAGQYGGFRWQTSDDSVSFGHSNSSVNLRNIVVNSNGEILLNGGITGNIGVGVTGPTALLHLKAGTATAGTAPLKFNSGTLLGTTEAGAVEYDGSHLYFTATNAGTRYQLDQQSGTPSPITIVNSSNLFSTGLTGTGSGVTSSEHSNFFGVDAGNSATSASRSNFFGYNAGNGATSAEDSNFLGGGAGYMAAGAYSSNFLGPSSGHNATSAFESNFFGPSAGVSASNAYYSNFFGSSAGYAASTASNSIFIGQSAGNNDTVDNTTDSDDWSILIGYKTNTGGYKNSVLIGGSSSSTPIENTKTNQFMLAPTLTEMRLRGIDYTLPSAQGGLNTVLTNNGSGVLSWSSAGSGGMSIGGAITSATQGSILFAGASGVLAQNNANLNWDDGTSTLTVGGDIIINAQKDLKLADADSSNWVAFQSPATVSSNMTWTLPSSDSSGGGCMKTDGSGVMSVGACGDTNLQTFTNSGNYTIPTNALMTIVEAWGGGGGGGGGYSGAVGTVRSGGAGGGGGAYDTVTILTSTLGAANDNIPVTVGAGGNAGTATLGSNQDGGVGGKTCLSQNSNCGGNIYISAYGGGGGNGGSGTGGSGGGGGGGTISAGATHGTQATFGTGGGPLGATAATGLANSGGGGGHGATAAATGAAGGAAFYGGAGGASSSSTGAGNSGAGGGSLKGGSAGGAGGSIATTYTRRLGGAGGIYTATSGGGGTAGANSDGSAGGNGANSTGFISGGAGGGGGTTGSAVVGGAGGNGGLPGGGGGGGGASNTTTVGSAGGTGGAGYLRTWTLRGSGADLAEVYGSNDDSLIAGDVVALDPSMKAGVMKTTKQYEVSTIGIISTNPGLTIGNVEDPDATPVLVALSGRVPVKVNMENGPIKKGDYLTSSSEPGVAMRATKAGTIIGQAMTEYTDENTPGYVVAFIKSGPSNGVKLAEILPGLTVNTDPQINTDNSVDVDITIDSDNQDTNIESDSSDEEIVIVKADTIQKRALQYFLANKINLEEATDISEIYTDRLSAALEIITPTVITDTLSTNSIVTSTGDIVSFNSPTEFTIPPLFNKDTAGFAIIKEGSDRVRIDYDNPYIAEPIVNINMSFGVLDGLTDIFAKDVLDDDIKSVVIDSDETGFTILLNKTTPKDLRFSWTALSVKDPKVFESAIDGLTIEDTSNSSNNSSNEEENIQPENQSSNPLIEEPPIVDTNITQVTSTENLDSNVTTEATEESSETTDITPEIQIINIDNLIPIKNEETNPDTTGDLVI